MKKVFKGVMLVFFAAFLVVLGGCSKSNAEDRANDDIKWQFISPADMKKVVQTEDTSNYQILDIQPKKDFAKGHIPGSISVPAYPVDTKELEKLVVDAAPKFKDGKNPIYVVCPGGGGGAKRSISLLIDEGIAKSRLYIVENGAKKWPYKDDSTVWVAD
ncbi:rhodanese-like domain-containing protein [Enterococcus sp. CSURQ0835]|uniref:rhodanese-like domain-containing protein n=1 Tax=Enterococcus sp. CSURQ0835 TaxID=2681394 RepID=UPI0013596850|nr:rhodanese-like domain-containing protein [Enterococcus sp. CSURQ0835]